MADSKITALTSISTSTDPANDPLVIVDVSDTSMASSGTTKKVTLNNLLACSPTATLASATITGDLTVDTNTLKVDSANNRVGIGTASPAYPLSVAGRISYSGAIGEGADTTLSSSGTSLLFGNSATWVQQVFYIAGSEAMRLNSTGLGIGASPTQKLHVKGIVNLEQISGGTNGWQLYTYTDGTYRMNYNGAGSDELIIDTSGNVGIGVTPSAWGGGLKALQVNGGASLAGDLANSYLNANAFYNGTSWIYSTTNGASRMALTTSGLQWYTAPSGTAGQTTTVTSGNSYTITAAGGTNYTTFGAANNNVGTTFTATSSGTGNGGGVTQNITFTQAMTLDSSGNLLVGKSSASATTIGFEGRANGTVNSTLASSVDANATYAAYSTGAAAYRFYVGMGGTVYATNTTISAISDARLKENVQDIDVGLGAILALKPRKFDWKAGKGKDIKGDRGFIAQEFEQVFPQLVDEWKDEAPEGEAPYKSVRQDLIPVLVKAIQELTARVQTLETR